VRHRPARGQALDEEGDTMNRSSSPGLAQSILLVASLLLASGPAARCDGQQRTDDAYFKPVDAGPGIIVCDPAPAEGSASLADFGSGCSLWLQWSMGFNPALGQTPRFDLTIRACQEMHLARLRLTAAQAKRLTNILGVTHAAVGKITGTPAHCTIVYQVYAVPALRPVGAAIKLTGSTEQMTAQLPAAAKAVLSRLGVKSPRAPDSVKASPEEIALAGHYDWYDNARPNDPDQERIDRSAELFPPAALLQFIHAGRVMGRPDEAEARRLLRQAPDNFLVTGEIATTLTSPSPEFGKLMDGLMDKITSTTSWPKIYWSRLRAGTMNGVVNVWERLVRINPHSSTAWINLAKSYADQGQAIRNGRVAVAITPKEYESLDTIYRRWRYAAERVVALDPDYAVGWHELAVAATFVGDSERADEAFWKGVRLNKADGTLLYWGLEMYQPKWGGDPKTLAKVAHLVATTTFPPGTDLFGLGTELRSAGFPGEATQLVQRAIASARELVRTHPESAAAHAQLGYFLNHEGKTDQAVPELLAAVRLDPHSDVGNYQLGLLYSGRRQFAEAIPYFRESARVTNGFNARAGLASALANAGQLDEAQKIMEELERQQPNEWVPHSQLGWVLDKRKQLDAALAEYLEAERLGPEFATSHRELCDLYQEMKRYDQAIQEGEMATQLAPRDASAYVCLAKAYDASDDAASAMTACRKAISISPDLVDAHYELGKLLLKAGNKAEGRTELQRVVEAKDAGDLRKPAQELLDTNR
jgi:tetratricopeptide (TPR) repeat protein